VDIGEQYLLYVENEEEAMKKLSFLPTAVLIVILLLASYVGADFYVVPVKGQVTSWDKKIPGSTRFQLVLDGSAVLDKETGLVWEKSPSQELKDFPMATRYCYDINVGGRKGWRTPTAEELASLVDVSNSNPALPTGHPFSNVLLSNEYWSATTVSMYDSNAWHVDLSSGDVAYSIKGASGYVWCVRGGHGFDAY